jgi:GMP synthase-like glutamine amidotransferase
VRVLAFRHVPFEDVGHIRPVLEKCGIGLECVDLYREGSTIPDTSGAAGLIFMGGPMSANDDLPFLKQEIELIAHAVHRGQPVLGVCLGSQLMARALGANVYPNSANEIGWFEIHPTEAASKDSLFSEFGKSQMVFHWHGETFDLPRGATLLAYSGMCRHQAFRFGRSAYGLQFHAEVTPEMIADWCRQDANCGDVRELLVPIDPLLHASTLAGFAARLFGGWANLL